MVINHHHLLPRHHQTCLLRHPGISAKILLVGFLWDSFSLLRQLQDNFNLLQINLVLGDISRLEAEVFPSNNSKNGVQ